MNIKENIKLAVKTLVAASAESPYLDVKILLEHATNKPREFLIAHDEYELSELEQNIFNEYIARRTNREPVAQIIEMKEFYGREFFISPNVLVPRPETEIIIDEAKKLFTTDAKLNILDLGTGTGAIILTLLAEFPNAKGIAVDISDLALANAEKNAYKLGIKNAEFVKSNWLESLKDKKLRSRNKFDLVVSNPPYVPKASIKQLEAELGFEPMKALNGGVDGLDCYREIATQITELEFKYAIFELGIGQDELVKIIFADAGFAHEKTIRDLRKINRTIIFRGKNRNKKYE